MRFVLLLASAAAFVSQAGSAVAFNPITPSKAGETVVLDGKHLTISQVVDVARYGAKVELTQAARQRSLNAYYLLLEGSREGIPIYFFNRGAGSGRRERPTTATSCSTVSSTRSRPVLARGSAPRSTTRRSSAR